MSDLDVTFLGSGTSVGIPMIGCECEVCRSDDPRDTRTRSSIHVRAPDMAWIVDTGPDLRAQILREGIRDLDAVLITHSHTDHIMGFDDLRRFCLGIDDTLPIYARPSVLDDLRRTFAFAFSGKNRYPTYLKPDPRPVEGRFSLGSTDVTVLPVQHGKVETVGFLFSRGGEKRLAYIPDCKSLVDESFRAIEGVGTLVIDGLRFTPHPTHQNFEEALATIDAVRPGRAFLTHISDEVMHARAEPALPNRVRLAYDGLRIHC